MLNAHDRQDLACLGLMVLVYGLVVAPVLHTVVGHEGTDRQHRHVHGSASAAHRHQARAAQAHEGMDRQHRHVHGSASAAHRHSARAAHGQDEAHGHDRAAGSGHASSEPEAPEKQPGHGPDGHQHLTGSVEHLSGLVSTWVQVEPPRVRWVSWLAEHFAGPSRAPGVALRPTAMPQGP